jgi:two-component system chemotaxis sensor kinase CheA
MGILSNLESEYDLEIVEEFFSHYCYMCESMEPLIISLSKEDLYAQNIQELFRIFHNIKSASGFLKLEPITKLAELTEDVLEEARVLNGPASEEFIDWLLLVSDQFEKYRLDIENDNKYFSLFEPLIVKVPVDLERK